jgi:hypothetical protein
VLPADAGFEHKKNARKSLAWLDRLATWDTGAGVVWLKAKEAQSESKVHRPELLESSVHLLVGRGDTLKLTISEDHFVRGSKFYSAKQPILVYIRTVLICAEVKAVHN